MATGRNETKTPMELAAAKGNAKALTALGKFTQVNTFDSFSFVADILVKVFDSCFYRISNASAGDSASDVVPNLHPDERQPRRFRAE